MKNFRVTVNGNTYDVQVEELAPGAITPVVSAVAPVPVAPVAPAPAPVQAPAEPAPAPAPAPKAPSATGGTKMTSPMPGKILDVKVAEGQAVKKGQVVIILEAMKMENEIVAIQDGTVAGINVSKGQSVEAGDLLLSLN